MFSTYKVSWLGNFTGNYILNASVDLAKHKQQFNVLLLFPGPSVGGGKSQAASRYASSQPQASTSRSNDSTRNSQPAGQSTNSQRAQATKRKVTNTTRPMKPPSGSLTRKRTATQSQTQGKRPRGRPRLQNDGKLIDGTTASDDEVEILSPAVERLKANLQRKEKNDEKRIQKLVKGFDVYMDD